MLDHRKCATRWRGKISGPLLGWLILVGSFRRQDTVHLVRFSAGSLPVGLSLNAIGGTPSAGGDTTFTGFRMVDTLLLDQEVVYDSRNSNDRLLLGRKGSLNEYELDLLRERSQEARRERDSSVLG